MTHCQIVTTAIEVRLIAENDALKARVAELEAAVEELEEVLVDLMCGRKEKK